MLNERRSRVSKAGMAPGTPVYTGKYKSGVPHLKVMIYNADECQVIEEATLEQCVISSQPETITWINVVGLHDINLISELGARFNIHSLVIEDILNTKQRVKVEEHDDYIFVVLKKFNWNRSKSQLEIEQISFVFGQGFLISFQEQKSCVFDEVRERLKRDKARLREHGSDYLAYSLFDTAIDRYFIALEDLDAQIEQVENYIMTSSSTKNTHELYELKRQMFLFRKVVWPLREAINDLLRSEGKLISEFTMPYLRDLYDHAIQVVDAIEMLRDMLSNLLDAHLSSLSNRMNEIMKVLTIISTLFIPLTFITGFYGMNFEFMPEIHTRWGYPITVLVMIMVGIGMLIYFRRKKWL